jgi:hypothetical protein
MILPHQHDEVLSCECIDDDPHDSKRDRYRQQVNTYKVPQ